MIVFGGAAAGAIVKMRCPHCETVQARARGESSYLCHHCRRSFTAEEAKVVETAPPPARRR